MSPRAEATEWAPRRSRRPLALVVFLFLGPLVAAALAYWQADAWVGRAGGAQHGELIDPARPVEGLALRSLSGKAIGAEDLRGRWTLLFMGPGDCGPGCRKALYRIRQAHKAQGRNIGRVRRLYLAVGKAPPPPVRRFLERKHPGLAVARPAGEDGLATLRAVAGGRLTGIYLLDPHANLVLRYGPGAEAKGILEDLEHLLKHSAIG